VAASVAAIVAAAGRGARLGRPKQLLELAGKPVVAWCLETLSSAAAIDEIVVACEPGDVDACQRIGRDACGSKLRAVVRGGDRRQDSVRAALSAVSPGIRFVVVHDGARPFVTVAAIDRVLDAARDCGAAVTGVRLSDTIKEVDESGAVTKTIPRDRLWAVQTPQAFAHDLLARAHGSASQVEATDDAMLIEALGIARVRVVEGSRDNVKITTPDDLTLAELIARQRTARVR